MDIESQQKKTIIKSEIVKRTKNFRTQKSITLEQPAGLTGFRKKYLFKLEKKKGSYPVFVPGIIARLPGTIISLIDIKGCYHLYYKHHEGGLTGVKIINIKEVFF